LEESFKKGLTNLGKCDRIERLEETMGTLFFLAFVGLLGFGIFRGLVGKDQHGEWGFLPSFKRGALYAFGSLAFLFLTLSFTEVPAGSVGVIQRFGQPVRQLVPGAHFILPFADTVYSVSTQTQVVKPSENASSQDLQIVHTEITLAYHVDPAFATNILVGLGNDAETRVITPAILEAIKATTARYDVQDLISKRPLVRDGIEEFVKARLSPYHIVAETTSITDFSFSKEFEAAIEAKVTAQQHAEKASNDLKRIQIEAEQQVAQAKGEAEALRVQKEQITPQLLQLRTIEMMRERWNGVLPTTIVGGNNALPMMDVLRAAGKQ
jgi:prohibitin 2